MSHDVFAVKRQHFESQQRSQTIFFFFGSFIPYCACIAVSTSDENVKVFERSEKTKKKTSHTKIEINEIAIWR